MRELDQQTIFLREHITLPDGIAVSGQAFCEGWVVLQSCDAPSLDKTIRSLGWNSAVLTKMYWKSGFGTYPQGAIHRAALLALRKVGKRFNAAEIGHIVVVKRLWFYLARVGIFSRYIQEGPFLGICDELSTSAPTALGAKTSAQATNEPTITFRFYVARSRRVNLTLSSALHLSR